MGNKTGSKHGQKSREKLQKTQENIGMLSKHGLRFWHDMATHGPKTDPKTVIFPTHCFKTFPGFVDVFGPQVPF